ncbi:hypothetical protein H4P12_12515 [Paracoccus sp. 11-3]|uniref:Catalase n=1 Tax=Paracoccus amoyensis TaxID=2760093 RepID=A0A926JBV2_9RHOB|nr:hypothetical protein [Paracoccus amoyensis]MBC9247511.1 hypothetical protein [Paracoccus amoyensis]
MLTADGQLAGSPSVLFDAVALILVPEQAEKLARDAAAVEFVMDAYAHLKAIGHNDGAKALLDRAGVEPDEGTGPRESLPELTTRRFWDREAKIRDLA